ncbi:MAG: TldD/PmbA family protein [Bacteroidales bacterium]|nr:TldD/PmbA family protein [Bacteroidales bacterium]
MIQSKQYYLNIFQVDVPLLETAIAEGLESGGNYCDLYFENTSYGSLLLRDGAVTSGGSHIDYGVGVRVLSGEKTGYAYSESTLRQDILSCARAAAQIASGPTEVNPYGTRNPSRGEPNPEADRYPVLQNWREMPMAGFLPFLQGLDADVRSKDSRIRKVIVNLAFSVSDILMYNSARELKYETRPMGSISVSAVFEQNGAVENKSTSRSFRCGAEMLSPALAQELAQDIVKGIDSRFEARRPEGGRMPVVMGAGASGILLHEAMGHAFEADFNRKGTSIFADKMGCRICPEGINILDDGTLKGNRGAINFDDEGIPGQKTYMVEDGVLTSYLHDRISAAHYGVKPTGNGRRESFRYAPLPRMRATYMESGTAKADDLIASVQKGIYVDEFSNGQVQIGEGDFTFYVKSGFMIENGRLTMPVKDINIIGNGPAALADIRGVADDLVVDPGAWTCGKEQSVPVSCGIPTVLIGGLTVGGGS